MLKIIFVFAVCLFAAVAQGGAVPAKHAPESGRKTAEKKTVNVRLTVYYFHGYARCSSCHKIEQYAKEAVERNFSAGVYAGKVAFVPVNIEEKPNQHFVNDYRLVSKSVILQLEKGGKPGRWENLDRIWLNLGDKDKFLTYIKDSVSKMLETM